ncbi:hypothetical protein [Oerskovia turbata]
MESTTGSAGVAVLALFVLWFAYYVPHRVKQRQQFLDSRVEDRFSGSLRVLGVSSGRRERRAARGHLASAEGRSLLLGAAATTEPDVGLLLRVPDPGVNAPREAQQVAGARTGHGPSSKEGPQTMETDARTGEPRPTIPPRRGEGGAADPAPTRRAASSSRIALLERRAKAARRRLVLTVLLLLATAGAWVAVGFGLLSWYVAAGPTAALVLVLVLGRQAVLAARKADAAWLAERRTAARAAARTARGPVPGSPVAPRQTHPSRVTGHAVRPSQANTQMIPRVTPADLERGAARARDRRPATGATARVDPESDLARTRSGASGGALFDDQERDDVVVDSGRGVDELGDGAADRAARSAGAAAGARMPGSVPVASEGSSAVAAGSVEAPTAGASSDGSGPTTDSVAPVSATGPAPAQDAVDREPGGAWDPVPVPRPTYTMKPTASETGVPPVQVAVPVAPAAVLRPAPVAPITADSAAVGSIATAGASVSGPAAPAPGDDKKPKTETLGLDLNEILARRRVSGG